MYFIEVKKVKTALLVFLLLLFFSYSFSLVARENSSDENVFLDSDQDDLSDEDEIKYGTDPKNPDSDSDGYKDGSEVDSGYDPLKPAPGDRIDSSNKTKTTANLDIDINAGNMTDEFSSKIAEMMAAGESTGIDMASINSLIEEKLAGKASFEDLPAVDESKIKIKKQDYSGFGKEKQARKYKEDNEEYLSSIFYIISNNMPHAIDSKEAVEGFSDEIMKMIPMVVSPTGSAGISYFTDLADKGAVMLTKLNDIEVPSDMLDLHRKGLQLSSYAISLKDSVKVDTASDPIASLISFSEVQNLTILANDYLTEAESKLAELGLTNFVMDQAEKSGIEGVNVNGLTNMITDQTE